MGKFESSKNRNEESELEEAFQQVTGAKKKKPASRAKNSAQKAVAGKPTSKGAILAICIAGALVILGITSWLLYYFLYTGDDGLILANVYAAGINLGGMTQEEAVNVLHLSTDHTYTESDMVIQLPDEELRISPEDSHASLDVEQVAEAAYQYGRTGSSAQQRKARRDATENSHVLDILPCLNLDTVFLQSVMEDLNARYNTTLTQPSVSVSGERPSLKPDEIDPEAPGQILKLTLGIPESSLNTTELYGLILDSFNTNQLSVSMDFSIQQPDSPDLNAIFQEYCVEAIDAVLDTETYEVVPETYGYGFDVEAVQEQLDSMEPGASLEISMEYLIPETTAEMIQATLFRDQLAYCETYQYSGYNRATNLQLACKAINGYILKPGDTFSYNRVLGERTEAKGYLGAGAYESGMSVTSIGGGICQVSSSLYYCTLLADLEVVERTCHQFASAYVPLGMDATVSWGSLDYKFKNNTNYPIKILAEASTDGRVRVWLMGTDEKDYYVKMTYSVLETYDWEVVTKNIQSEANEKAYQDGEVITTPYTGYDVETYKCKYSKETNQLLSTEYEAFSNYDKRDKVVAHIIYPEPEPTVPEETTVPSDPVPPISGSVTEE